MAGSMRTDPAHVRMASGPIFFRYGDHGGCFLSCLWWVISIARFGMAELDARLFGAFVRVGFSSRLIRFVRDMSARAAIAPLYPRKPK